MDETREPQSGLRRAREKTRQKLRSLGVDPSISEKPELSMDEANAIVAAVREHQRDEWIQQLERQRGEPPPNCIDVTADEDALDGIEEQLDAVGESHDQRNLAAVFQKHSIENAFTARCWAVLMPEPSNSHDPNAVAVEVDNRICAYLPTETAALVQEGLLMVARQHAATACCKATVNSYGDVISLSLEATVESVFGLIEGARDMSKTPTARQPAGIGVNLFFYSMVAIVAALLLGAIGRVLFSGMITATDFVSDLGRAAWDWLRSWFP